MTIEEILEQAERRRKMFHWFIDGEILEMNKQKTFVLILKRKRRIRCLYNSPKLC